MNNMKRTTIILILFLITVNSFIFAQNRYRIQKGFSIGLNFSGWQSRYFSDVYFQHRFESKFGYFISIGGGQFGNFIADGKTKKWFKHIDYPGLDGITYYKSSNIGVQLSIGVNYEFNIADFLSITPSIYIANILYNRKYEYDGGYLSYITGKYDIFKGNSLEYNIGLGFNVFSEWIVSKKVRLLTGFQIPFYLLNPYKLDVSNQTHQPLRGTDPILTFGIKYNFKK